MKYKYDCGKCPIASSNKNLKEINSNTFPCAECKNSQLCNTKKFFEKQLFCLEKTENTTKTTNGIKVCNDKCFVHRNRNNGKECIGHRCNVREPPFYCLGVSAKNKEFFLKISKLIRSQRVERQNNKVEHYHYDCGKCPSGIYNLSYIKTINNLLLLNKLKKINMTNVQCAQCNNSPNCNSDFFFEHQMFCWEKDVSEWEAKKGNRVCEKETCFVGVEEIGLVQGCGKCSDVQNLTKCNNCSTFLCNNETILPTPIKCFRLNPHFQPYKVKEKKCDHVFDSCYIARDVFGRAEQNCGDCPKHLKFQSCKTCNKTDFCNVETLLPLTTTTEIIITNKKTSKKHTTSILRITVTSLYSGFQLLFSRLSHFYRMLK
ncbi:hypothetical protein Mgra_00002840 [Meloidogyne graminicola]|uniref:Uncharacterized protein n=1 Tax=Meloidogyne graminicola TaxID=189291 RepID=A0A8S9ZXA6_9BILA|nr:hypothetical protein Mgra_00002840 [Meloidogyne graminicola]